MTTPEVLKYTAFAEAPDGGNPAGVVLDASGLSDEDMQRIAAEVGYSETAFVLSGRAAHLDERSDDGHDSGTEQASRHYRVRYWSPVAEVPFCGHATVATAVALSERDGTGPLVFDTPAGIVSITTNRTEAGQVEVAMTSVEPQVRDLNAEALETLLELLGLTTSDIDPRFPPREAFAGNWHPILVVSDASVFHQFRFSPPTVADLMKTRGWTGTVTVLHEVAAGEFLARNLFPVGRITEDPATGSAAASTGAYLRSIGYSHGGDRVTIHQGAHVGRPSLLTAVIPDAGGITVLGSATPIPARHPGSRSPVGPPSNRRLVFDVFGSIDAVRLVSDDIPEPGPGEIRVRVRVAGLNPVDWQIVKSAALAARFGVAVPSGYGNDFAGVVDAVGQDVHAWQVGDRVFGGARGHAVADYIVLAEDDPHVHHTPDDADDLVAGVIDIAGRTASAVAESLSLTPADTVLIGGAAGGVGTIFTQLAVLAGARVIGTGSPHTAPYLRTLGVEPVPYGPGLADQVRAIAPDGITAAADLYGTQTALAAVQLGVASDRIAAIESTNPPAGVRAVSGGDAQPGALERLLGLISIGKLRVPVQATYSIADYRQAITRQAQRHAHGKLAIVLDQSRDSNLPR